MKKKTHNFSGVKKEDLQELDVGGCKFSCYSSEITTKKTGKKYFRVFCSRMNKKCKPYELPPPAPPGKRTNEIVVFELGKYRTYDENILDNSESNFIDFEVSIEKETPKAWGIKFTHTFLPEGDKSDEIIFFPKSNCKLKGNKLEISKWLIGKQRFEIESLLLGPGRYFGIAGSRLIIEKL